MLTRLTAPLQNILSTHLTRTNFRLFSTTITKSQTIDELKLTETKTDIEVEEIRIDVPWGFITGKWWGPKNCRPILCLHGWQDNAGTFDTLIPLLPKDIGYFAIDWPGHGLSSRIPDGLYYSSNLYLHVLNIIKHHFEWKKLSLLGHSMSAILSFVYAGIFNDCCDLLIGIDSLKPHQLTNERLIKGLHRYGDEFYTTDLRNRKQLEPPSYLYDELVDRWVKGTHSSITKEAAPYLMKRAISRSRHHPDKFFYTRDSRLKTFNFTYIPQDLSLDIAKRITAPMLNIKAINAPYYEKKEYFNETIDVLKQSNPNFEFLMVDSTHHCHLTDPNLISGPVSEFILKHRPNTH